jgi:hypothetical protein
MTLDLVLETLVTVFEATGAPQQYLPDANRLIFSVSRSCVGEAEQHDEWRDNGKLHCCLIGSDIDEKGVADLVTVFSRLETHFLNEEWLACPRS